MGDDLRSRLAGFEQRVPDGDPDVGTVLRRGRRRKLRRRVAGAGLLVSVALAGAVSVPRLIGHERVAPPDDGDVADHSDGSFVPAEEGEPTYDLYDFEILYPWAPVDGRRMSERERDGYCSVRGEWECGHRRRQAGFSYSWRWATKRYPGEVACRVTLWAADGSVVGAAKWAMSGLEPRSRQPDVIGVHVSERPVTAGAECEAGAYAPGRGFDVEFVRSERWTPTGVGGENPPPERIRLVFEAEALADAHVDSRMCFMTVWFESGRKETAEFTTNAAAGTWEYETGYPASDPVVDAKLRCRAIRASDGRP